MTNSNSGTLYVVATPIGNLADMTERAVTTLREVDRIAAEDTRHSEPLLRHYEISKPKLSLHNFNERERVDQVLAYLKNGESIALISDAGTPLISDPGYVLVKEAIANGITVSPIPGACAAIAALSAAGLPTDRFVFEGFLPAKNEARKNKLLKLNREERTMIFYEAPHRLLDMLKNLAEVFGDERHVVVAREVSKRHESIMADSAANLASHYAAHHDQLRGEVVVLVAGVSESDDDAVSVYPKEVLVSLLAELPLKQAVSVASKLTGVRRNHLYDQALAIQAEKKS